MELLASRALRFNEARTIYHYEYYSILTLFILNSHYRLRFCQVTLHCTFPADTMTVWTPSRHLSGINRNMHCAMFSKMYNVHTMARVQCTLYDGTCYALIHAFSLFNCNISRIRLKRKSGRAKAIYAKQKTSVGFTSESIGWYRLLPIYSLTLAGPTYIARISKTITRKTRQVSLRSFAC